MGSKEKSFVKYITMLTCMRTIPEKGLFLMGKTIVRYIGLEEIRTNKEVLLSNLSSLIEKRNELRFISNTIKRY